jgi:hypothetical protein
MTIIIESPARVDARLPDRLGRDAVKRNAAI